LKDTSLEEAILIVGWSWSPEAKAIETIVLKIN